MFLSARATLVGVRADFHNFPSRAATSTGRSDPMEVPARRGRRSPNPLAAGVMQLEHRNKKVKCSLDQGEYEKILVRVDCSIISGCRDRAVRVHEISMLVAQDSGVAADPKRALPARDRNHIEIPYVPNYKTYTPEFITQESS